MLVDTLYHWSQSKNRQNILKRGLRPTCPTGYVERPTGGVKNPKHLRDVEGEDGSILGICTSTNPYDAWLLSIFIDSEPGDEWDCWQIFVKREDEIHYRPSMGHTPDEIRIANVIPRSRLWYIGSRTILPHERRRK